jgi:UDP-2-acetamido-2,6-beta-L-arabino-hexul-4-ose reductase
MLGEVHRDTRGELVEFANEPGQIYVSRTHPGAVRANHYHLRKTERFLVVEGNARLRLRRRDKTCGYSKFLSGATPELVDILPTWIHSIENVGDTDMILVVWSSEVFNPYDTDTYAEQV